MSTTPFSGKQDQAVGIRSNPRQEIFYKVGLVLQTLGAALLAVLYPMGDPFYSVGIMLFEAGVLLSACCVQVENSWIKKVITVFVFAGIALQVYGLSASEEYAGSIIIGGIGIVCMCAAGMAGMEARVFRHREGWILAALFPTLALANLLYKENRIINAIGFSLLFLLLLSLAGKKLRRPRRS